mmetsp:Transcript_57207/g.170160  ORF Transcript_57207/g.170160 Transcript_57207/m.170160 type:complete len:324 (-) Transcript_57207:94-1065(-)
MRHPDVQPALNGAGKPAEHAARPQAVGQLPAEPPLQAHQVRALCAAAHAAADVAAARSGRAEPRDLQAGRRADAVRHVDRARGARAALPAAAAARAADHAVRLGPPNGGGAEQHGPGDAVPSGDGDRCGSRRVAPAQPAAAVPERLQRRAVQQQPVPADVLAGRGRPLLGLLAPRGDLHAPDRPLPRVLPALGAGAGRADADVHQAQQVFPGGQAVQAPARDQPAARQAAHAAELRADGAVCERAVRRARLDPAVHAHVHRLAQGALDALVAAQPQAAARRRAVQGRRADRAARRHVRRRPARGGGGCAARRHRRRPPRRAAQ